MRNILRHIVLLLFCASSPFVRAQEKDRLASFIESNPNAVDFNIIYEGSKLNLSSDDDYLLVNLSIAHPALQMRFLMQKTTIYVDPSGKRRKDYEIVLPNALDVKTELEAAMPQSPKKQEEGVRPDIRPLISALNRKGADYLCNDVASHLGFQYFHIELDQQQELLNYYILIPKDRLMKDRRLSDKWSIGVLSMNDMTNMPPPDQQGEGRMMPPPLEGENQQSIQELMQSDIRVWTKFSIDDVNNANLENQLFVTEPVAVDAVEQNDCLEFRVTVYQIETQLTFLMQGLSIKVIQPDTLLMSFPSAAMVRNKMRRHPNEVKAVLESGQKGQMGQYGVNHVVRPDVQPLVAALNDTIATIVWQNETVATRDFRIDVDREKAVMTFTIMADKRLVLDLNGKISVLIVSTPLSRNGDRPEFDGKRLSGENAPHPNGLGEGLRKEDISKRTYQKTFTIGIKDDDER